MNISFNKYNHTTNLSLSTTYTHTHTHQPTLHEQHHFQVATVTMECITTSHTPLIIHPESTNDWVEQQQAQLRWTQHPKTLPNNAASARTTTSKKAWAAANPQRTLLHIPGAPQRSTRIEKYKTPTKTPTKATQEWEALLKSSLTTLQQAYATLETTTTPPPAPRSQPLPAQAVRPDLDRAGMASRALQAAAGCFAFPPQSSSASEVDDEEALSMSGSEGSEEGPATPAEFPADEEMNLDPRLFG